MAHLFLGRPFRRSQKLPDAKKALLPKEPQKKRHKKAKLFFFTRQKKHPKAKILAVCSNPQPERPGGVVHAAMRLWPGRHGRVSDSAAADGNSAAQPRSGYNVAGHFEGVSPTKKSGMKFGLVIS